MRREKGGSLVFTLLTLAVMVSLLVLSIRIAPSVLEYWSVQKAVARAAALTSEDQARQAFDAEAKLQGIASVRGSDLLIDRTPNGALRISFAYDREFALLGPAYLTLRYRGHSQ